MDGGTRSLARGGVEEDGGALIRAVMLEKATFTLRRMCRPSCSGGRRCPAPTTDSGKRAAAQRSRGARLRRKLQAAGVTVTHGRNTPITYVAIDGDHDFDPGAIPPIVDRQKPPWKPEGGLWSAPPVDTGLDGVATAWTQFHADEGNPPAWQRLVPVCPAGGGVVIHIDNDEDVARLRRLFPPRVVEPDPDDFFSTLATESAPFSFESMRAAGVAGVHVSSKAAGGVNEFYSWDVDSTVWLSPESVAAREPVDAAQLPAARYDIDQAWDATEVGLGAGDQEQWTVGGLVTLEYAADAERRLTEWDFDSPTDAFRACKWYDAAKPERVRDIAVNWTQAHRYAAAEAERRIAAAASPTDRAAAEQDRELHLARAAEHDARRQTMSATQLFA